LLDTLIGHERHRELVVEVVFLYKIANPSVLSHVFLINIKGVNVIQTDITALVLGETVIGVLMIVETTHMSDKSVDSSPFGEAFCLFVGCHPAERQEEQKERYVLKIEN
jgi:hypothetical protein